MLNYAICFYERLRENTHANVHVNTRAIFTHVPVILTPVKIFFLFLFFYRYLSSLKRNTTLSFNNQHWLRARFACFLNPVR